MTERTYGLKALTLDEAESIARQFPGQALTLDLIAHIRSLQAEVARLAADRDGWVNQAAEMEAQRDNWAAKFREEEKIVSRIWEILGNPTYEQLAGRSIYDLIARLTEGEMRMRSILVDADVWLADDTPPAVVQAIRSALALPLSADAGEPR